MWMVYWLHDDIIKRKHFPPYWPFVGGIHRSPVNSPHNGQWRGALVFSLICAWINGWVNNRDAGDLRRNRAHYDVIVMPILTIFGLVALMNHPISTCCHILFGIPRGNWFQYLTHLYYTGYDISFHAVICFILSPEPILASDWLTDYPDRMIDMYLTFAISVIFLMSAVADDVTIAIATASLSI